MEEARRVEVQVVCLAHKEEQMQALAGRNVKAMSGVKDLSIANDVYGTAHPDRKSVV